MPDIADKAQVIIDTRLAQQIDAARAPIQPGEPGDCELCGEESGRLVVVPFRGHPHKACAPCRDKYHLG